MSFNSPLQVSLDHNSPGSNLSLPIVPQRHARVPSMLSMSLSTVSTFSPSGSIAATLRHPTPHSAVSPLRSAESLVQPSLGRSFDSLELPMRHRRANAVSLSSPLEEVAEFAGPRTPSGENTSMSLGGGVSLPQSQYFRWPRHGSISIDSDPGTPASTQTTWYSRSLLTQRNQYGPAGHRAANRRCILRPAREVHAAASPGGSHIMWAIRDAGATDKVIVPPKELCAICLELLRPGEVVQPMVHCSHLFHESCIQELLRAGCCEAKRGQPFVDRMKCPLCRGTMAASSLSELPQWERDAVVEFSMGTAELPLEDGGIVQPASRVRSHSLNWDAFRSGDFNALVSGSSGSFTDAILPDV